MKINRPLVLVSAAAAAWYLFGNVARAAASQTLQFVPAGVSFSGSKLNFKINVQNPSNTSIKLNSLSGQLSVNGETVGTVSSFTITDVRAMAITPVTLTLSVSLFGAVALLYNVIQGNIASGASVNFKGYANVNGTMVPLNLTYKII